VTNAAEEPVSSVLVAVLSFDADGELRPVVYEPSERARLDAGDRCRFETSYPPPTRVVRMGAIPRERW
jgi:hypothetical protein